MRRITKMQKIAIPPVLAATTSKAPGASWAPSAGSNAEFKATPSKHQVFHQMPYANTAPNEPSGKEADSS